MSRVLVTGSQGFIGSYVCAELLAKGYEVVGVDKFSKYGRVSRGHDDHPNFTLCEFDCKNLNWPIPPPQLLGQFDYVIAGAAMIGGISYFHKYAYDLLSENERIIASTYDFIIKQPNKPKVVIISSSMVYENVYDMPQAEDDELFHPAPDSAYGFQKLAAEYFGHAAHDQYGIPYTIVRPFNCVGVGEHDATGGEEETVGNMKMMLSHVLPDLVNRALKSKPGDTLALLGSGDQIRHYTNGKDLARGIVMVMEYDSQFEGDVFNISSPVATTVKELATMVWRKIHGCDPEFTFEKPFFYDVQVRSPCTAKAKSVLGFETEISLEESVDEVISWMKTQ